MTMSRKKKELLSIEPGKFTSTVTEVPKLRKFHVQRSEDVSGLSGTGIVAVGVMYPTGLCIMEWLTPIKSINQYHSIADLEALHGHEGRTTVVWDGEL
jgi:hypothetical protein